MTEKLITVVIPTYNREKFIKNTIDSVLNQTYQNFEIIVVDDGSTDNTKEVVKSINDNRVIYIYQNNSGAQTARNNGIINANGDFISFLDSDDEWFPNNLQEQVKILEENNYDKYIVIHSDGIIRFADNSTKPIIRDVLNGENVYAKALSCNAFLFPTVLTSKQVLQEIGLLDTKVLAYQEWDTAIRLAKKCKFIHINKPLFYYNCHKGKTISKDEEKSILGYFYILKKHKSEMIKYVSKEYYNYQLSFLYNRSIKSNFNDIAKKIYKTFDFTEKIKLNIEKYLIKKEKNGDKRKIIIFGLFKISYKKKRNKKND